MAFAMTEDDAYCLELVKTARRESYAALLFMPDGARGPLAALEALDIELSRIPHLVSQPMAGEIRLQWWREAATGEGDYDDGGAPVARALRQLLGAFEIPPDDIVTLIDAHAPLLQPLPFATMLEASSHAEQRFGTMFRLRRRIIARALGRTTPSRLPEKHKALANAAQARGRLEILELFARRAREGQCLLPVDFLESHQLSAADVTAGAHADRVGAAFEDWRGQAERFAAAALTQSKSVREGADKALGLALLPLMLIQMRLRQLSNIARRPYVPPKPPFYARQLLALWLAARQL